MPNSEKLSYPIVFDDLVDAINGLSSIAESSAESIVTECLPDEVEKQLPYVIEEYLPSEVDTQLNEKLPEIIEQEVPSMVGDWLGEHVDPSTGYVVDDSLTIQDAAADAKATGDQITDLKSALNDTLNKMAWSPSITKGKYYKQADGTIGSSSKYGRTSALWNGSGDKTAISCSSSSFEFSLAFYTAAGDPSTGAGYIGYSGYKTGLQYIPSTAIKFGLSFRRTDQADLTNDDVSAFVASLNAYGVTDTALTQANKPADAFVVGQYAKVIDHDVIDMPSWELGTISTSYGTDSESTTRIRTVGYLDFEKIGMYSYADEGYKHAFRIYDQNKNYIAEYVTRFASDVINVLTKQNRPLARYFRIIAAKSDDSTITAEEVDTVADAVHIVCSTVDPTLSKNGYSADAKTVGDEIGELASKVNKSIKILGIGNSYTRDILRWVWKILKECGYEDVTVGHGYIGGITLKTQYESLQDDAPYHSSYAYWKYTDSQDPSTTSNKTLDSIVNDEPWDVVIFQQQSDEAGQYTSFVSDEFDINDFVSYILTALPNTKIGIALTWSHAAGYTGAKFIEYYGGDPAVQLAANKTVIPQVANHMTKCDYVLNYGLAVEEGRNNAYLGALGTEMLRSDKNHLYYGIPSYMCGLVLVKTVTNADINELTWYPNSTDEGQTCVTSPYLAWLGKQCAKIASDKMS